MRQTEHHLLQELGEHLPHAIFGVTAGILLLGVLSFLSVLFKAQEDMVRASSDLFHVFHSVHILLSAITTTAMFWWHGIRFLRALLIGLIEAIGVCGVGDILLPFLGGRLLGMPMDFHLCMLEHPRRILPFVLIGLLCGFLVPRAIQKSTQYSHVVHILVSSMASIFYLISFGFTSWINVLGSIFVITIAAVVLPCCVSDVVFPLWVVKMDENARA